jgi:hypothetical protein
VLSRPEFASAVLEALRSFTRPELLVTSPLLRSRLVSEESDAAEEALSPVEALRTRILAAARLLLSSPREEKFYHALRLTYFEPAPTQEIASERLDIPFRTFRRHLKSGIQRLTEILWRWEIGLDG